MMTSRETSCCGNTHSAFFCPMCDQVNPRLDRNTLLKVVDACHARIALLRPVEPHGREQSTPSSSAAGKSAKNDNLKTPAQAQSNPAARPFGASNLPVFGSFSPHPSASATESSPGPRPEHHASVSDATDDVSETPPATQQPPAQPVPSTRSQTPADKCSSVPMTIPGADAFSTANVFGNATPAINSYASAFSFGGTAPAVNPYTGVFTSTTDQSRSTVQSTSRLAAEQVRQATGHVPSAAQPIRQIRFFDTSTYSTPGVSVPPKDFWQSLPAAKPQVADPDAAKVSDMPKLPPKDLPNPASQRPLIPTKSLGHQLELSRGRRFELRLKVWHGPTCNVCPQEIQAKMHNKHPVGFCKLPTEEKYWEIMLNAVSEPALPDRCVLCAVDNPKAAESHTTAEHGMARWYDHPDNPDLPPRLIQHYNPAPGLDNGRSKHGARSDIPPLQVLFASCKKNERFTMLNTWKDKYERDMQITGGQNSPEHAIIATRYQRYQAQMSLKSSQAPGMITIGLNLGESQTQAKGSQTQPTKGKKKSSIPPSDYLDGRDTLPSKKYRDYLHDFLTENEKSTVNLLLADYENLAIGPDEFIFISSKKRTARTGLAHQIMNIYQPKEIEYEQVEGFIDAQEKLNPKDVGPKTNRDGLFRKRFSLDKPFTVKGIPGRPEAYDASYTSVLRRKLLKKTKKTLDEINGASLDANQIPQRSPAFHIQDYPVFQADCAIHIREWALATLKDCKKHSQWVVWRDRSTTEKLPVLLSQLKETSPEYKSAQEIVQRFELSARSCVLTLAVKLWQLAKQELGKPAVTGIAEKNESIVPIKMFDFAQFIKQVKEAFDLFNQGFDHCLKEFVNHDSIKPLFDIPPEHGKRHFASIAYLGNDFPAETDVRAVIPRLAWPVDFCLDNDEPVDEDEGEWLRRAKVPGAPEAPKAAETAQDSNAATSESETTPADAATTDANAAATAADAATVHAHATADTANAGKGSETPQTSKDTPEPPASSSDTTRA